MKKKSKEEQAKILEKNEKKLMSILNSAVNAKAWSDLLPITREIYQLLSKNKDEFNFSKISGKQILAKRLAQCLNPECPSGVHETVLDIYFLVLHNIVSFNETCLMDNLGIYACGLFPFFPNASLPNKKKFIDKIIMGCFMFFRTDELTLCLPGLLSSLIQGLDDNNEENKKDIYEVFRDLSGKVGQSVFYGIYWTLILRNKLLRPSGMKYLIEKITKYSKYLELSDEKKKLIIINEYPNINTVVVNALSQVIEETDIPTVRTGMDFIISRLPLTKENNILSDHAKITLLISALKLLVKNDYSATRRLKGWILDITSPDDEVNLESDDMNYKIDLVVQAFQKIFNPHILISSTKLQDYIKIVDQFLEQQMEFTDKILPKISYNFLLCIVKYWQTELNSSEKAIQDEVISKLNKFFRKDNIYLEWLWISVAENLELFEKNEIKDNEGENKGIIGKDKVLENVINEALQPLKFCLLFLDFSLNDERIKFYIPIITHLLNIMRKFIINDRTSLEKLRNILLTILILIKNFQENLNYNANVFAVGTSFASISTSYDDNKNSEKNMPRVSIFQKISNEEENIFEEKKTNEKYNIMEEATLNKIIENKENISIINNFTEAILNFEQFFVNILKEYINIDNQLTKNEMIVFRRSTEIMIRLQEYAQQSEVPQWVIYLQKIIFNNNINLKLSLEAANFLLDMNLSTFNHHEIYKKIQENFQKQEIESGVIDENMLEILINKTGVQKNCQELLMGKLYLILSEQSNQKTIIDLLIKIANIDQIKFLNIICNTFNLRNFDSAQESMKLFSDFWKLSNEYYNEKIFFKNGECIFKMIDSLDDDNPLLRHLSKIWLNQTYQQFDKILDPIFSILIKTTITLKIEEKKIIFESEYDTGLIRNSLKKLKNIILNSSVMTFMKNTKPTNELLTKYNLQNLNLNTSTYLSLLLGLTLKLTQGKCIENFTKEFKRENYSVNASSCEFLEFLLSRVDDKEILMQFALDMNEPIIFLLDQAIVDNDEVMQVQLLTVLRVLYFNSSEEHLKSQKNKNNALKLFNNENLIKCLKKGMTSKYFYVRENFIKFTNSCLPLFSRIMNDATGLKTYYDIGSLFITELTTHLLGLIDIEKKGRKDNEKFSQFDVKNAFFIFKNYLDEYKENKRYDENDVLLLLTGIKHILFQFLGITEKESILTNKISYWIEFKKMLLGNETKKISDEFLGFFNNIFDKNTETEKQTDGEISAMPKNLFSRQIFNLINCLLLTWINQSDKYEDYDYCLNANGILPMNENAKWGTLSKEDIYHQLEKLSKNPIKKQVCQIAINLFKTNPIEFIDNVINIWCFSSQSKERGKQIIGKVFNDKQNKLSIIELLISLKIPFNILLNCIAKILQRKLKEIDKEKRYKKHSKLKIYITPYEFSLYEAKIFHFLYSYILLNPILDITDIPHNNNININNQNYNEKYESWKEMINLLNIIIDDTKITYTYCWIYELLQLFLKKFPINQIRENTDIKKGARDIFSYVTNKLTDASFENKFDSKYVERKKIVLPFLPHVYFNIVDELFKGEVLYKKVTVGSTQTEKQENQDEKNNLVLNEENEQQKENYTGNNINNKNDKNDKNSNDDVEFLLKGTKGKVNDFYRIYFSAAKVCTEYLEETLTLAHDPKVLNDFYRNLAYITLKENFYNILTGIYDINNINKKVIIDILKGIINLIKKYPEKNEKNYEEISFYAEFSTDFLAYLMKENPNIITLYGKDMFVSFLNGPSFFDSTAKMLRNWRKIISSTIECYPELLSDLFKAIDTGFLFIKGKDKDKINTLRRISFVIYSCKRDTFGKEFEDIKSKAKELLSDNEENIKLKDEIFLMMRVLFLRFSHEGVMKMIKDLWPIIFMELLQNIENEKRNKDVDLVIESFKFIELLSLANVEEFTLYEWIFILDTYDMNNLDTRNEKSILSELLKEKSQVFKPIAVEFLKKMKSTDVNDDLLKSRNTGKSELYICPTKGNMKELLYAVKKFCYSIIDMNSYKVPVNYDQIEDIIENDFLDVKTIKQKKVK